MLHGARVDRPRAPVAPSLSDTILSDFLECQIFFSTGIVDRSSGPSRDNGLHRVAGTVPVLHKDFPGMLRDRREMGEGKCRKPRKIPGLPNRPFLENRVKRPDSIRGKYIARLADGARYVVFKIWVSFRPGTLHKGNLGGPEIKSRRIAIRGCQGHYMGPDLGVFWRSEHYNGPDYRRYYGSPTVTVKGACPVDIYA
jgi:hypothetical protein